MTCAPAPLGSAFVGSFAREANGFPHDAPSHWAAPLLLHSAPALLALACVAASSCVFGPLRSPSFATRQQRTGAACCLGLISAGALLCAYRAFGLLAEGDCLTDSGGAAPLGTLLGWRWPIFSALGIMCLLAIGASTFPSARYGTVLAASFGLLAAGSACGDLARLDACARYLPPVSQSQGVCDVGDPNCEKGLKQWCLAPLFALQLLTASLAVSLVLMFNRRRERRPPIQAIPRGSGASDTRYRNTVLDPTYHREPRPSVDYVISV